MRSFLPRAALIAMLIFSNSAFGQNSETNATKAGAFVAQAEKELAELSVLTDRAEWINATDITGDTDAQAAERHAQNRTERSLCQGRDKV